MKITINEPCHENWDQMTPNDRGAFCLSCQKNVVDFSNKTVNQIKDFFRRKTSTESVCGRFDEQQLTALSFDDFFSGFKKWNFLHRVAVIVFFVFGFALFGNAQSNTNDYPVVKMGKVAYIPKDTVKTCKSDTLHKPKVKGQVRRDPKKDPKKPEPQKLMGELMIEDKNTK